jgi:organic radical activating enzyme
MLRVSRIHVPVTALGPGRRVGIWVQGCSIGCAGCMSQDTWDPAGGEPVPVSRILSWLAGLPGTVTGLTVSGGEPFQQCGIRLVHEPESAAASGRAGQDVRRRRADDRAGRRQHLP